MKRLWITVLVWLVPLPAGAEPEPGIAFKGGPNAATLAEDNRFSRYGFSGGLAGHLQWLLVDRFSLAGQMELLYTPRGAEVIFDGVYVGRSRERYLDLTLAARPGVRFGRASGYLLLGGGLNLLLSAEAEDITGAKRDITGDLRRIDVALLVGTGIALRLPRRQLGAVRLGAVFLEARHDRGLIDSDAVNGGFKNRTSSLMFGLSFVLAVDGMAGGAGSPDMRALPGPGGAARAPAPAGHLRGSRLASHPSL